MYACSLGPTCAIWANMPPAPVLRSILKPDSLLELSFQARLTWVADAGVAVRPDGAAGAAPEKSWLLGTIALGVAMLDQLNWATAPPPFS